jgi:hypothetical protein
MWSETRQRMLLVIAARLRILDRFHEEIGEAGVQAQ